METHREAILAQPNVVGLGIGHKVRATVLTDQLCLVVMVRRKLPTEGLAPQAVVPPEVEGVPTDVMEVGVLRALQSRSARWRPAPAGVSIGHFQTSAGTLGCVVRDRASGGRLILSNNHVLANSNEAQLGDPVLQPGPADGGRVVSDTIAHLERFSPIAFTTRPPVCPVALGIASTANALARQMGSAHRLEAVQRNPTAVNWVDAAVARPVEDADILEGILEIGVPLGVIAPALGTSVRKSGATTGLSSGRIIVVNATTIIDYGPGRTARFDAQIVTTNMSQGGDSGSLLVAGDSPDAVGLLFAGSPQVTVHNEILAVLGRLDVSLGSVSRGGAGLRAALARARTVLRACQEQLLSKPNVVAVRTGMRQKGGCPTGEVALVVLVTSKVPSSQLSPEQLIPGSVDGVRVDVQEAGFPA
jgi:hypothetical protein